MIEIGQLLRQTRESKNLTLADVEAETRIRQRYLNALESGDWDDLPNPVAARGFLRRYATFLGLDPDELTTQFDEIQAAEQAANPAQVTAPSPSDYRPIDLDLYDVGSRRSRTFRRILTWILVLIPAIILIYLSLPTACPISKINPRPKQA